MTDITERLARLFHEQRCTCNGDTTEWDRQRAAEYIAALAAAGLTIVPTDQTAAAERERLRALAVKLLPEYGVGPTFSRDGIHGWRCEYPDCYGPCECFDEVISNVFDDPEPDR